MDARTFKIFGVFSSASLDYPFYTIPGTNSWQSLAGPGRGSPASRARPGQGVWDSLCSSLLFFNIEKSRGGKKNAGATGIRVPVGGMSLGTSVVVSLAPGPHPSCRPLRSCPSREPFILGRALGAPDRSSCGDPPGLSAQQRRGLLWPHSGLWSGLLWGRGHVPGEWRSQDPQGRQREGWGWELGSPALFLPRALGIELVVSEEMDTSSGQVYSKVYRVFRPCLVTALQ